MSTKKSTSSKKKQTQSKASSRLRYTPVPGSILFKAGILIAVLIVAAIAMTCHVTDAVVWSFLTMIAGYAALSNPQSNPTK